MDIYSFNTKSITDDFPSALGNRSVSLAVIHGAEPIPGHVWVLGFMNHDLVNAALFPHGRNPLAVLNRVWREGFSGLDTVPVCETPAARLEAMVQMRDFPGECPLWVSPTLSADAIKWLGMRVEDPTESAPVA